MDSLHSRGQNLIFATVNYFHTANQIFDCTLSTLHPMALMAEKEDNESYTFKQMLLQDDKVDFIKAMMKEAGDHESKGHWEVVHRSEKPPEVKTILAIWAFKRKRYPDGRIWKHKARLCAHGGVEPVLGQRPISGSITSVGTPSDDTTGDQAGLPVIGYESAGASAGAPYSG